MRSFELCIPKYQVPSNKVTSYSLFLHYVELVTTGNLFFMVLSAIRYLYYKKYIKVASYINGKKRENANP